MALKMCKMLSNNGIKIAIFSKKLQNFKQLAHSLRRGRPPFVICLSYITFFASPSQFNTYFENSFWFKFSPFNNTSFTHQLRP